MGNANLYFLLIYLTSVVIILRSIRNGWVLRIDDGGSMNHKCCTLLLRLCETSIENSGNALKVLP